MTGIGASTLRSIGLTLLVGLATFVLVYFGLGVARSQAPQQAEVGAPEPMATPDVAVASDSLTRQVRAGDVAVGVPTVGAESLLANVRAGDRLNVVASVALAEGGPATAVVVNGARVLAPASADSPLLLEVTAGDAMTLAHLIEGGTRLSYSVWSTDGPPATTEPLDADAARARLGLAVATAAPPSATPTAVAVPTQAPATTPAAAAVPTVLAQSYTVQPGDTLDTIAAELGLDVGALWWSNRALLQSGPLAPGMQLMVPNIHGFLYQVQSGDTWDSIATTFGLPTLLVQQLNQPSRSDQPRPGELVFIPRPTQ